jgi:two-component system, NtrC family, response regulator HydG
MLPLLQSGDLSQLEQCSDPSVILDRNFNILATNSFYRNNFHQGREVSGHTCYQVSHGFDVPCDKAGESCPLKSSILSDTTEQELHIHELPSGKEFILVEITPIKDLHGSVIYYRETLRHTLIASAIPKAEGLVGASPQFMHMLNEVHRVACDSVPVLLLGESGTGKELIAQVLHSASHQSDKPLIPLECSGLTETLFESELFGHCKGAFTGATANKKGLIDAAEGGTLFLDEIGDVPLSLQVKLLRLLESHTYRKVGETEIRHANFRLLCATNKDLDLMMSKGQFRRDLYYRISIFPIRLPPLRERIVDIGLLSRSILLRIAPERDIKLSNEAEELLKQHDFPGNIRELVNLLERARILTNGNMLKVEHFPYLLKKVVHKTDSIQYQSEPYDNNKVITLKEMEKNYLNFLLENYSGSRMELAKELGLSMRTLSRKIKFLKVA